MTRPALGSRFRLTELRPPRMKGGGLLTAFLKHIQKLEFDYFDVEAYKNQLLLIKTVLKT